MAKGKVLLSIAAVVVLGLIDSPAVVAQTGWEAKGVRKTNGDFGTASTTFVPITDASITFTSAPGMAMLEVSATVVGGNCPASQIGIRFDGADYEGEWSQAVTQAGGVAVRGMPVGGVIVVPVAAGTHTATAIVRWRTIDGICNQAILAANPTTPLTLVAGYPVPLTTAVPALSILGTVVLFAGLLTAALFQLRRRRITHST